MDHPHQQASAPAVHQHAAADASGSSCATAMQQQPQGPRAVEQQTRTCSQQQLLKLELLHILVDMRKANQKSSAQLVAAMAETDAVLQNGLRALELANRVLTTIGPSWVADRALTAAEIAMAAAVQRLSHMNGIAQELRTAAAAAQQTRANSGALNGGAAADDEAEDDLRDTCSSILRELGDAATAYGSSSAQLRL